MKNTVRDSKRQLKMSDLQKRIEDLEAQVKKLTAEIAPPVNNVQDEVRHLIRVLGPDGAAKELNRRNRLRRAI